MKKRAIILSNGIIEDPSIIHLRLKNWEDAIVIAADGGYHHAESLKLEIHSIVGDLDSISKGTRSAFFDQGIRIQSFPPDKDETDLELALLYALNLEMEEILVLGAIGGRLDMTLSNILLSSIPRLKTAHVEFWYGTQTAWVIHPPGDQVQGQPDDTLSLITISGTAKGITTTGLTYPLKNENLKAGRSRGLSNVLSAPTATIAFEEGLLLAIHTPGRA